MKFIRIVVLGILSGAVATQALAEPTLALFGNSQTLITKVADDIASRTVEIQASSVMEVRPLLPGHEQGPPMKLETKGIGSGVVLGDGTKILTCAHVLPVDGPQMKLSVVFDGQRPEQAVAARVAHIWKERDLAVIEVDQLPKTFEPISFADVDSVGRLQLVIAAGSPMGLTGSVSLGYVSAVREDFSPGGQGGVATKNLNVVQHTAAINGGNSGGPLVNLSGELIGINSFIFSRVGENNGLNFAISTNTINEFFNKISADEIREFDYQAHLAAINDAKNSRKRLTPILGQIIENFLPGSQD